MEEIEKKWCPHCKEMRPVGEFYRDSSTKDGYDYLCKYHANIGIQRTKLRHVARTGETYEQTYERKHPGANARRLRTRRMNTHGMTDAQYEEVAEAQGNRCAICGSPPRGQYRRLVIDHNYYTGAVRGLLCTNCARGLRAFADKPDRLTTALSYLEQYESK